MKYHIFTTQEKWSIVKRTEASSDKSRELAKLGIPRSTYYDWLKNSCEAKKRTPHHIWNKTPSDIEEKIIKCRLSGNSLKTSPARIMENLEYDEGYLITESGVKSVLTRFKLNNLLKPKKKHYYIRPKAEKFLDMVCVDDIEFIRYKPHDTFVLNFTDEASYMALESRVYDHRTNGYDIILGLKAIYSEYGHYPKKLRLDNAQAHKAKKVIRFCRRHGIKLEFITKGCPEENWPIESWHRNLNQDVICQHSYATIHEWQTAIDQYTYFHNHQKRLRSDTIKRTPHEIAFSYTTPLTQARLKVKLIRKHRGQSVVQKYLYPQQMSQSYKNLLFKPLFVSEMCVS